MPDLLDDKLTNEFHFGDTNSPMLKVDPEFWEAFLLKEERNQNIVFLIIFLFFLVLIPLLIPNVFVFFAYLLIAIILKTKQMKFIDAIKKHGAFYYRITDEKVVRFSETQYTIFYLSDIKDCQTEPYGLLLLKEKETINFLMNAKLLSQVNPSVVLLPYGIFSSKTAKRGFIAHISKLIAI